MATRRPWWAAFVLFFLVHPDASLAAPPRRHDTEAKLLARLQRESNPIKKAKLEVRLGRVRLLQAIAALDRGNMEETNRLLGAYMETLNSCWTRLKNSGRVAHKKPAGFKQLDIELREDARYLEDLRRRIPYDRRAKADQVAGEVDQMRNEVLRALFPPIPLRKGEKKSKK
jgi:hypothetical protein